MKRTVALILAVIMVFSLAACDGPGKVPAGNNTDTKEFTDSLGRAVTVPANIEKVAVSGPLAQIMLFALCPDKLVGIAAGWDESANGILDEKYYYLPELGQIYGTKGQINPENILASGAEIVIDVGETKKSAADDLDALQEQIGIPFVHITVNTATVGDAYRQLGDLLAMEKEAGILADYCEKTGEEMRSIAEKAEKKRVLYCLGAGALSVIAKDSYHGEILDMMTDNVAVLDEPSSKGTGNEVDMEQILKWNPDYIFFATDANFETVIPDASWQSLDAIKEGHYYEVPFGPFNWMGFPPSVQRYLGLMWMAKILYPEEATFDLYERVNEYFKLFYHCDLSREKYDELTANSIGRMK